MYVECCWQIEKTIKIFKASFYSNIADYNTFTYIYIKLLREISFAYSLRSTESCKRYVNTKTKTKAYNNASNNNRHFVRSLVNLHLSAGLLRKLSCDWQVFQYRSRDFRVDLATASS